VPYVCIRVSSKKRAVSDYDVIHYDKKPKGTIRLNRRAGRREQQKILAQFA